MTTVWVYALLAPGGALHPSALELLTKARSIGDDVAAVALGPGATDAAPALGDHGAGRVYANDDALFVEHPGRPAATVLAGLIDQHRPDMVMFPGIYDARDVAGRVQARTGATLMANATDVLDLDHARTEILGGEKIVDVALDGPRPHLVLVRPRSIPASPTGGVAEIVQVAADTASGVTGARVVERHEGSATGSKLEDAEIVLAGGRGLGGAEAFELLDALASTLPGTAVGASRAAVDAGWVPYSYQIGQTGKTVKPGVYIAVGVSGALQHVVGMKGATRIVAINKDRDAPIMRLADLGIVGDLFQVVPALTEEIRRRAGS